MSMFAHISNFKFRVALIFIAIITLAWLVMKIRKLRIRMEDSIFWVAFSVILILLSLGWPIILKVSQFIGLKSPSVLALTILVVLLYEKIFTLSVIVSKLQEDNVQLCAEIALRDHAKQNKVAEDNNKEEDDETKTE